MRIEVENTDGTWSVLNCAAPGQDPKELALIADRWRALQIFGSARVRIVQRRGEDVPW